MPKLLTVAGRGMSGLLSAAHFTRWTDYEIEIIGDPDTVSYTDLTLPTICSV